MYLFVIGQSVGRSYNDTMNMNIYRRNDAHFLKDKVKQCFRQRVRVLGLQLEYTTT